MRCRHCNGELLNHYGSAYKCDDCGRVFDMFEEESFEDLKSQNEYDLPTCESCWQECEEQLFDGVNVVCVDCYERNEILEREDND